MINVILTDHNGDTDTERVLGGYSWNRANGWTVSMPDSHAEILKATPEAAEFKFVVPDQSVEASEQARASFAALTPGVETPAPLATRKVSSQPTAVEGSVSNG